METRGSKDKTVKDPPKQKTNRLKRLGRTVSLRTKLLYRRFVEGVRLYVCLKHPYRPPAAPEEPKATVDERGVLFSDVCYIHTYPAKRNKQPSLSLKKVSDSFPPRNLAAIAKIAGTAKETPLAKKVIQAIEKKQALVNSLKEVLHPQPKEPDAQPSPVLKKPKSHILDILDGYSEASISDVYLPHQESSDELPAPPPKSKSKRKSKSKSKSKSRSKSKPQPTLPQPTSPQSAKPTPRDQPRPSRVIDSDDLTSASFNLERSSRSSSRLN